MKELFNLYMTAENPVIKNHVVHGQALLPGLAYIDMLYQLAYEIGLDYRGHCLKRLSIFNPLIIREVRPVKLKISFDKAQKYWKITVEGAEIDRHGNSLQDKLYITAEFHEEAIIFGEQIDTEAMKQTATQCVDIDTVYAGARKLGLMHQGMIKARGNIYLTGPGCLIEVNVDDAHHDEAKKFLFHPALIDGAAMASGVLAGDGNYENNENLYLPLYYESFSCLEPLRTHCYARANSSSLRKVNDINTWDIDFFNTAGKQVAQLKGITAKLVRSEEQINPDLKKETSHKPYIADTNVIDTGPSHVENILRKIFSKYLNQSAFQIDLNAEFFELGFKSSQLLAVLKDIEDAFDLSLNPTLLFEQKNLRELIAYLEGKEEVGGVSNYSETKGPQENNSVPVKEGRPSKANTYVFYENEAFLQDHLVYGQPALMGVTHPCLALEAYIQDHPMGYPAELKNVQFLGGPVTLKKTERVHVQVQFEEAENQTGFKTVHYVTNPNRVKPCCQGEYIRTIKASPEIMDIKAMLSQSKQLDRETVDRWYQTIKDFTIGPMLQTIDSAYVYDNSTVISKVSLSGKLKKGNVSRFVFDPLLLMSCYQIYSSDIDSGKRSDKIFIPLMIERLTVYRPMTETAYIVKTIRSQKVDFVSFDAIVLTEEGESIAEISNASVKEVVNPSRLSNASFDVPASESVHVTTNMVRETGPQSTDIAIIGLAGRYPKSNDVKTFWENLRDGRDCITQIPGDRWDWREYYTEDRTKSGYMYSKWGGFVEDVDKFDPLFFNISPREAEILDPKDRLFLETVWNLLENTGYTRETLLRLYQARVGVYVGAMDQQYHFFDSDIMKETAISLSSYNSIANRVSYFFNFQGPSIAVDTMCSSALISIHMACESLKRGECQIAVAGGVNLLIHPKKYLGLSLAQIIGSHPDSRSFADGDGYIPSEGVGAVLLKPLSKAIRDRDSILAVIKSTATNHGGHTSGYNVPNPKAQAQLIEDNFIKSGIDPRTIGYVESAANGSPLGDSLEIAALNKAFRRFTQDKQFCAIGSVKSNIGHAEAASGMLQLTKVVLQLQHQQLVPTIKAEPLNPNISFDNTPFYLQSELQEWKRPVVRIRGEEREFPRRATVSSFGAGGSNAHLIIEEYIPAEVEKIHITSKLKPQIVIFSAKNQDRLLAVIRQMIEFIELQKEFSLSNLAYTLQVGREAMEFRIAMVVNNQEELVQGMKSYLKSIKEDKETETSIPVFAGELKEAHSEIRSLFSGETGEGMLRALLAENNLEKLALLWTQGVKIPWKSLYEGDGDGVRIISLPTYPFARVRCWVSEAGNQRAFHGLEEDPVISDQLTEVVHSQGRSIGTREQTEIPKEVNLKDRMISYLKQTFSNTLKIKPEEIDKDKGLDKYGLDSIIVLEINNRLEQYFPDLSKTLFFEYSTINDLATYFIESHNENVLKLFQEEKTSSQIKKLDLPLQHSNENQNQILSPDNSRLNRAKNSGKNRLKNAAPIRLDNVYNVKDKIGSNGDSGKFTLNQIKQNSVLLDDVIRHFQLEIFHSNQNGKVDKDLNSCQIELPDKEEDTLSNFSPFQSFAPFEKVIKDFSFSSLAIKPGECIEDIKYVIEKQIELRKVLFFKENFSKCKKVLDIGCGIATDIIEIVLQNPSIIAHGLTISNEEAAFANKLILKKKLENNIKIFCVDNSKHVYQDTYDIVFGIQVMHFLNEFSQKNILFEKISSAINANGKILLAEFIGNLKRPIQDHILNVTVHSVNDWVKLLSNNNLLIEEIIDVSMEINNFLYDPEIDQNIKDLDKKTRIELKKITNQAVSLQNKWISYCLMKIVKDNKHMTLQERIEVNLEKIENKKLYKESKREMVDVQNSITYNPDIEHFSELLNSKLFDLYNPQQRIKCKENESLLIHEKELKNSPELAKLIADIDSKHTPVGYIRLNYPYFFISSEKNRYLRLIIDQSNKLIIPYAIMDESLYRELLHYCQKINHQLLIVYKYNDWIDSNQTRLIPMGVWQDIDIGQFTLKGNKMRKLRYLVEKFKKSGDVKTEEYHSHSSLPLKEIKELLIQWSQHKKNIIHHSFVCMEDLLQQALPAGHRAFLTYHNKKLCSIIVIEKAEDGVYLMDQEFYDPKSAPLGHLEYSIVGIIDQLKKENAKIFSIGSTWYPFIFEDHPKNDPEGWAWLKDQNDKQTLLSRIFQQAKPNYQFKKKFGVVGEPIFAYLPHNAPFSLLLNYWPVFYQNSLTSTQLVISINKISLSDSNAEKNEKNGKRIKTNQSKKERQELLDSVERLDQLKYNECSLDLLTDSWFSVRSDAVKKRTAYLKTKSHHKAIEELQTIFPFKHIILTTQGRIAEFLFYQVFPKTKKKILTTIPWATTLMHRLNNGFDVIEIPDPQVILPGSTHIFKGEMDLEALKEQLQKESNNIAMAGLEVLNNASGGYPVRLAHIHSLRTILQQYKIPLVLDASRIVRNSFLVKQYEKAYKQSTIWDIITETSKQAQHIVTSLSKDFASPIGGMIATNDDQLAENIRKAQLLYGQTATEDIESMIIQALSEQETIVDLITSQMTFTKRLNDMLIQARVPILQPAYGHCIVIDVSLLTKGESNIQKKTQFLNDLFLETGIRAAIHQVGKQKNTILDKCIRLAFPLGLTKKDEECIYNKLHDFFIKTNMPDSGKRTMEVTVNHV